MNKFLIPSDSEVPLHNFKQVGCFLNENMTMDVQKISDFINTPSSQTSDSTNNVVFGWEIGWEQSYGHLICDTGPTVLPNYFHSHLLFELVNLRGTCYLRDKNIGRCLWCFKQIVYERVDWTLLAQDTVHLLAPMNRVKSVQQKFEFSKLLSNCNPLKKTDTSRRFNSSAVSAREWNFELQ
jgi:hypothetical protein